MLTHLSIQQNLLAQLFWGLTVFLVIVFATVGLRGIAAQFGLLQNQRIPLRRGRTTLQQTSASRPHPGLTSETLVEWDEEF